MTEIKTIVCATDLTEASAKAVEMTRYLQAKTAAQVKLVHVMDTSGFALPGPGEDLDERAQDERKAIDDLAGSFGGSCVGVLLEGDPAAAIADYTKIEPVDLLIVGTHRYKGLDRLIHGSTADSTLRAVSCPVMRC